MSRRDMYVQKINAAKAELLTAGCIHRRDLQKYIRRMERELRRYDKYQAQAHMKTNSA